MNTNRKYVIVNTSEVIDVDFTQVDEDSIDTLRFSLDGTKTFFKFTGATPLFLNGRTTYTYKEIKSILNGVEWTEIDIDAIPPESE